MIECIIPLIQSREDYSRYDDIYSHGVWLGKNRLLANWMDIDSLHIILHMFESLIKATTVYGCLWLKQDAWWFSPIIKANSASETNDEKFSSFWRKWHNESYCSIYHHLCLRCFCLQWYKKHVSIITVTPEWVRWHINHRSLDYLPSHLLRPRSNRKIKAPRHWPLWRESTCDWWILLTKGQ